MHQDRHYLVCVHEHNSNRAILLHLPTDGPSLHLDEQLCRLQQLQDISMDFDLSRRWMLVWCVNPFRSILQNDREAS